MYLIDYNNYITNISIGIYIYTYTYIYTDKYVYRRQAHMLTEMCSMEWHFPSCTPLTSSKPASQPSSPFVPTL